MEKINSNLIILFVIILFSCNNSSIKDRSEVSSEQVENKLPDSLVLVKNTKGAALSFPELKKVFLNNDTSYVFDWKDLVYLNSSNRMQDLLKDSLYEMNESANSHNEFEFKLFYYKDSILFIAQKDNNKILFKLSLKNSIYGFTTNNIILVPYFVYEDENDKNKLKLIWASHVFYLSDNCSKILDLGFGTTSEGPGYLGFLAKLDSKFRPQNYSQIEKNRIMQRGSFVYESDSMKIIGLKEHYSKNNSKAEMDNVDSDFIVIDNFKLQLPLGSEITRFYELLVNDSIYEYENDLYLDFIHTYSYKTRLFNSSMSSDINEIRIDPYFAIYRYIDLKAP